MPDKESNEYLDFLLDKNLNSQEGSIKAPLLKEGNAKDSTESLDDKLLQQNLNANKSLKYNLNLNNISILRQNLTIKDDNANINRIKPPLTNFSTTNHTLKKTIPILKLDNQSNTICKNEYSKASKNSSMQTTQDSINIHKNQEIIESIEYIASKPSVYMKNDKKNGKNKKKIQKIEKNRNPKKAKQKRNPLFRLTLLFAMLCFIMIIGYKILANGIFIERLHLGNIALNNIFLQLQNKLVLNIDSIDLRSLGSNDKEEIKPFYETLHNIIQYTQKTIYVLSYFEKLHIKKLQLPNKQEWSINYTDMNYRVEGTLFDANFAITNNHNNINLEIRKFQLKTFPLHFEGELTYSIPNKQLFFDMNAIKDNNIKEYIALKGETNFQNIALHANSSKLQNINLVKPFIDGIQNKHLRETLQDWMFNNIKYDNVRLANLSMNINLERFTDTILHTTIANIVIDNPEVSIAKNIQPITAKQVTLTFKDANLTIKPLQPIFAGMDLSNSEIIIANMPHSDVILDLNGKNVRYDSNLAKLLKHYNVVLPIIQPPLAQNTKKLKTEKEQVKVKDAISNTENLVTTALQTKTNILQSNIENTKPTEEINKEKIYENILELNPQTTLTNEILYNPNITESGNDEMASMHLQIAILHNNKMPTKPLLSIKGIIQAKHANVKLYDIPLKANKLNVALDITPNQKLVYINGNMVRWQRLVNADINVLLDLNKQNIQANTYIHKAILNSSNLKYLKLVPNTPTTMQTQKTTLCNDECKHKDVEIKNIQKSTFAKNTIQVNQGVYLDNTMPYNNMQTRLRHFNDYSIHYTNHQISNTNDSYKMIGDEKKKQLQNIELSPEVTKSLSKQNVKDEGESAKKDDKVLKDLKISPVWNNLKIHEKKTKPFKKLNTKELTSLALEEIEKERDTFFISQDFLNIKNANIHLNLSFANDKITLDVPALSLHLESSKNLQLNIENIENILQFSPLAKYYGIANGNFSLHTTPYPNTLKENFERIDFTLNITQLKYPLYTIKNKRVTDLSLKGQIQDNSIIIFINDDIDFKSQDSLSMLRIKGYRINVDEALHSKIPVFVDLFNDKQNTLPYSEAAISQELKFIAIKNRLRKQMKVNPTDFNIIGENLQFTFLGYTAPFDSVNVRFIDGRIMIDGQYDKGIFNASLIKDNVYFRAKNFSDDFMNIVLTSVKGGKKMLDGGAFSFDGIYSGGILNASLEIQNTALIDFKSVQNIFAIIDTIPSLFMFRNPHISTKGYQINYGKVLFAVNSDYIGLQNIFLLGSSMDISGQGIIDIDTQEMNVNLSISTIKNLSNFINKIPIIGYLILGRDGQISTNLILSGKYTNPKVNITLATDIIKAPFNILKRIFPVEMLANHAKNEDDMINY